MFEFLSSPLAQIIILLSAMAVMIALGVFVVGRFRGSADDEQPTASDWMTNFRELHSQGQLSDQEFRNIKTQLGQRLQNELKDNEQQG